MWVSGQKLAQNLCTHFRSTLITVSEPKISNYLNNPWSAMNIWIDQSYILYYKEILWIKQCTLKPKYTGSVGGPETFESPIQVNILSWWVLYTHGVLIRCNQVQPVCCTQSESADVISSMFTPFTLFSLKTNHDHDNWLFQKKNSVESTDFCKIFFQKNGIETTILCKKSALYLSTMKTQVGR